jgi:hypothetical protein
MVGLPGKRVGELPGWEVICRYEVVTTGQLHMLAAIFLGKSPFSLLNRRLVMPWRRSGHGSERRDLAHLRK